MVLTRHLYLHMLKHINGSIATAIVVVRPCCDPAMVKDDECMKLF